jgi:hypothetical protein
MLHFMTGLALHRKGGYRQRFNEGTLMPEIQNVYNMTRFRAERLITGGSLTEGDDLDPMRGIFVALLLSVAIAGVIVAAIYG